MFFVLIYCKYFFLVGGCGGGGGGVKYLSFLKLLNYCMKTKLIIIISIVNLIIIV